MNPLHFSGINSTGPVWLCLRSQPKHEHIAGAHLRRMVEGIDVFSPRLRIRRQTRRGAIWFVEALFPGYLFARFNPEQSMLLVRSAPGVKAVVGFGAKVPIIREEVIEELRSQFDENEVHEVPEEIQPGDEVTIAGGPFHGFSAEVLNVRSATGRVQVLLEMLGRCTPVELSADQVITGKPVRRFLAA
jgi:transcription antitermination factor NusG